MATYTIKITPEKGVCYWKGQLLEDDNLIEEKSSDDILEVMGALESRLNERSSE